eukprot:1220408-Prymnesium_polylepis.1
MAAIIVPQLLPPTHDEVSWLVDRRASLVEDQHVLVIHNVHEDPPFEVVGEAVAVLHRERVALPNCLVVDRAEVAALLVDDQLDPGFPDVLVLHFVRRTSGDAQHHHADCPTLLECVYRYRNV